MIPTCAVPIGGMIGTVARFWLNTVVQARCSRSGFLSSTPSAASRSDSSLPTWRPAVAFAGTLFLKTDLCGGFTTMSAFSFDTVVLFQQGSVGLAALDLVATLAACLIAIWLGQLAGAAS